MAFQTLTVNIQSWSWDIKLCSFYRTDCVFPAFEFPRTTYTSISSDYTAFFLPVEWATYLVRLLGIPFLNPGPETIVLNELFQRIPLFPEEVSW
jgi:hypothetical protein